MNTVTKEQVREAIGNGAKNALQEMLKKDEGLGSSSAAITLLLLVSNALFCSGVEKELLKVLGLEEQKSEEK